MIAFYSVVTAAVNTYVSRFLTVDHASSGLDGQIPTLPFFSSILGIILGVSRYRRYIPNFARPMAIHPYRAFAH